MIVYTCGWLLHGLEALALNKYNQSASLRGPPNLKLHAPTDESFKNNMCSSNTKVDDKNTFRKK